ncbi:MAG: NUDIX hydrolase [Magnetococcales bacterium]|nr:NUDIX hydrolase [Magnetococcales bacterium]
MTHEWTPPAARFKVSVSAHVLIRDSDHASQEARILLARLAYRDHRAGKWSFPGGFVDQGEGLEAALKREVAEEIGLELLQCRYLETVPVLLVESPNIGFIFLCDSWNGQAAPRSREILETLWVDEQQFWQLDQEGQLAYPQMRAQAHYLGWHPPKPDGAPTGESRCIWSKVALMVWLAFGGYATIGSVQANDDASVMSEAQRSEAMQKARNHLLEAVNALKQAGSLTYDAQAPHLKEKAKEAIEHAQKLIQDLTERMPRPAPAPSNTFPGREQQL